VSGSPRHSVSVAGIILDNQSRVLAIRRRDTDHWQPPGGVLKLGETIIEGLRREGSGPAFPPGDASD
jgi:8-oxo-dGTP diphosphatase